MLDLIHPTLKATILGSDAHLPASLPGGETARMFSDAGAIVPPHDPETLCRLFEHSNSLRQNIDAYATNIDGFGHRLESAIDFDDEDADRRVAECIYLERVARQGQDGLPSDAELEPSDGEIEQKRRELGNRAGGTHLTLIYLQAPPAGMPKSPAVVGGFTLNRPKTSFLGHRK